MLRNLFRIQKLLDALFDEAWFNFGVPEATEFYDVTAV